MSHEQTAYASCMKCHALSLGPDIGKSEISNLRDAYKHGASSAFEFCGFPKPEVEKVFENHGKCDFKTPWIADYIKEKKGLNWADSAFPEIKRRPT